MVSSKWIFNVILRNDKITYYLLQLGPALPMEKDDFHQMMFVRHYRAILKREWLPNKNIWANMILNQIYFSNAEWNDRMLPFSAEEEWPSFEADCSSLSVEARKKSYTWHSKTIKKNIIHITRNRHRKRNYLITLQEKLYRSK